jgi:nucleoside-diphosphate-sugar epimerase
MRVFLAGASGVIGRRLVPLLLRDGHVVIGTTRSNENVRLIERAGAEAAVVDVYDARALEEAVRAARPEVVIHQLTDLPSELDEAALAASLPRNARIRMEGTRNLIAAAQAASARRLIVQSIAFVYAPGCEPHAEADPLNFADTGRALTVRGVADMEQQALCASGLDAVVLRYGALYGPGTWYETAVRRPALHIDASAQAALLAVTRGAAGIYNIADDDGVVSISKARDQLGFEPHFRLG